MTDLKNLLTDYVRAQTPEGPPPSLAALDEVNHRSPSRGLRWTLAAAAAIAVITGAAALRPWVNDTQSHQVAGLTVLSTEGASDHLPSQSVTDWVTYADHVVVVTPVAQAEVPPAETEVERGEGLIGRRLTLRVDDVLWSRPEPDRPAPESFEWLAAGWKFEGTPANRGRVASEGAPRLEMGHSYILAIEWEEARCSPGDPRIPAQWRGLGSFSSVPFDDGVVGQGEYEGSYRPASEAMADSAPNDPNYSFAQEMAGGSADDVRRALERATPQERQSFTPPAPCD